MTGAPAIPTARSPRRSAARVVAELLFPPRCFACGVFDRTSSWGLCGECHESALQSRSTPACPTCAADVAAHEVKLDRCSHCRGHSLKITAAVRVGAYASTFGALMRGYKYEQREELSPLLSTWLAKIIDAAAWRERVEAIVAVPTHWRRRFTRPFHAADALADLASRRLNLPCLPLLRRLRAGPHQVGLSITRRAENVRGAFALSRGVTLRDARILLIDDVRTSGATLEECARILKLGGASEIYSAVVCRVSPTTLTTPTLRSI